MQVFTINHSVEIYLFKAKFFIVIVIFCTMLLYNKIYAQAPGIGIAWNKAYGSQDTWNEFYSIQQTRDNGYIITGFSGSPGKQQEVWLFKIDSHGDSLWTKMYGGISYEYGNEVQQTYDGGYVVVGYTGSFSAGICDVYLIKTDSLGNVQWTRTYGGPEDDRGESVIQTKDGGYAVAGFTRSYGLGYYNIYLVKTDSLGNEQWTRTYGGLYLNYGKSIKQTDDGGYIITGFTDSYSSPRNYDVYVIRTNSFGDTLWTRTFGGLDDDQGIDVDLTINSGYIIAGWTGSFNVNGSKLYIIKLDSQGNKEWIKIYGSSEGDVALSIKPTMDYGYIITGWTTSSALGKNIYLLKINGTGDSLWATNWGGGDDDYCRSVIQASDGGYVAAGLSISSYNPTFISGFIIKTTPDIDTIGTITPERSVLCIPNPFGDATTIHFILPHTCNVNIAIYNLVGIKVATLLNDLELAGLHFIKWDGKSINGIALPAGIYFCQFKADGFSVIKKIVKLK